MLYDRTKFAEHIRSHTGYKSIPCSVAGCDQTFTNHSTMRSHLKRHHGQALQCDICAAKGIERRYATLFNLREHHKIVHEGRLYYCPKCSRQYKSHKAYSVHVRKCSEAPAHGLVPSLAPPICLPLEAECDGYKITLPTHISPESPRGPPTKVRRTEHVDLEPSNVHL